MIPHSARIKTIRLPLVSITSCAAGNNITIFNLHPVYNAVMGKTTSLDRIRIRFLLILHSLNGFSITLCRTM